MTRLTTTRQPSSAGSRSADPDAPAREARAALIGRLEAREKPNGAERAMLARLHAEDAADKRRQAIAEQQRTEPAVTVDDWPAITNRGATL
jgi:hypothetical protein